MTNITDLYANSLKNLGITINADKTLSVDEKTFKSAEISDIKDTFTGSSSFSKSISSQASFINDAGLLKYYQKYRADKSSVQWL